MTIVRHQLLLPFLVFASLAFMKFRVVGIPLSDIFLLLVAGYAFLRYGHFSIDLFAFSFLCFVTLTVALAVFTGGGDSLVSALKLAVPLFSFLTLGALFRQLDSYSFLLLSKRVLFFGVWSQLLIAMLFLSGLTPFLFNEVSPGNVSRTLDTFQINVFQVPLLGFYRFGGLFIEPSWFAFFFGFFLLMFFYLVRHQVVQFRIRWYHDAAIIAAFVLTLSFTGLVFLFCAYLYRFIDLRQPIRLVILVPLVVIGLTWLMVTNDYFAHRIYLIASGNDGSFNARVFASLEKAWFIFNQTDWLGAGPANTLKWINQHYQQNLSIQNGYLEAFAATGLLGGLLFLLVMHCSALAWRNLSIQMPLALALFVSSVIFTPIFWMLAFFVFYAARSLTVHNVTKPPVSHQPLTCSSLEAGSAT